jgi:hypothetical protein
MSSHTISDILCAVDDSATTRASGVFQALKQALSECGETETPPKEIEARPARPAVCTKLVWPDQ